MLLRHWKEIWTVRMTKPTAAMHNRHHHIHFRSNNNNNKGISALPIATQEKVLLTRLQTLCDKLSATEPIFQHVHDTTTIDVGGSFLSRGGGGGQGEPENLDFFMDTQDAGERVLLLPEDQQAPIPMFPEDFPPGSQTEHPLSWWGILDPDVGRGKYAPHPSLEQHPPQPPYR
mmetsp:Transcript_13707/g.26245  ORF Transcript_13707/g.26245 Transcript_13707/m.26245 type:complete len:173 (+) Transcript_13707:1862-2380(+)